MPVSSFDRLAEALGNNDTLVDALLRARSKGSRKPTIHINKLFLQGGIKKKTKKKKSTKNSKEGLLSTVEMNSIQRAWENSGRTAGNSNNHVSESRSSFTTPMKTPTNFNNSKNHELELERNINTAIRNIETLQNKTSNKFGTPTNLGGPQGPWNANNNARANVKNNLGGPQGPLNSNARANVKNNFGGPQGPLNANVKNNFGGPPGPLNNSLAGPQGLQNANNSFKRRY